MKNITIISFLLLVFILSCETSEDNGSVEACYRVGPEVSQEACERAGCAYFDVAIGFLGDLDGQPCMQGANATAWFEYTNKRVVPGCYPKVGPLNNTDGYPSYFMYCKQFTSQAVYVFPLPHYQPPPSGESGWFLCTERFALCESTCGNGTIEAWERCDGNEIPCDQFDSIYHWIRFQQGGSVKCNSNCTFDFSECTPE